jgi:hypothetical protein
MDPLGEPRVITDIEFSNTPGDHSPVKGVRKSGALPWQTRHGSAAFSGY